MNQQASKKEGIPIDFATEHEQFNVYQLADGSRVKIKFVVTAFRELKDGYNFHAYPVLTCRS